MLNKLINFIKSKLYPNEYHWLEAVDYTVKDIQSFLIEKLFYYKDPLECEIEISKGVRVFDLKNRWIYILFENTNNPEIGINEYTVVYPHQCSNTIAFFDNKLRTVFTCENCYWYVKLKHSSIFKKLDELTLGEIDELIA